MYLFFVFFESMWGCRGCNAFFTIFLSESLMLYFCLIYTDRDSMCITLHVHYGGEFRTHPHAHYSGGHVKVIDYVEATKLCKKDLDLFTVKEVGNVNRRYYILMGSFKFLWSDNDVVEWSIKHISLKEMHVYVGMLLNESEGEDSDGGDSSNDDSWSGENMDNDKSLCEGDDWEPDPGAWTVGWLNSGEPNIGIGTVSEEDADAFVDSDYEMQDDSTYDDVLFDSNIDKMASVNENSEDESSDTFESDVDVVQNDNELDEHKLSDEDEVEVNYPIFNPALLFDPTFELGMVFSSKAEFRKAVQSHAIRTKRTLKFTKNDKVRVYVRCAGDNCQWRINLIKVKDEATFQIRQYNPKHKCPQTFNVKNVKTNWLCERYIDRFKSDPKRTVKGFRMDVIKELRCNVSKDQAYRAKRKALKEIEGSPDYQYTKLWDYAEEIKRSNPGSTVVLGTEEDQDGEHRFSRMYICFYALKQGFLAGCRPIIGVDGCHLKGPHGGILLTAVSVDPNNTLYPIAYSIVSKECRETWEWFLLLLKSDLQIVQPEKYTFISDK